METNAVAHKTQLQTYFDGVGFERWSAIYGGQAELSYIRRTVRDGHAQMLQQVTAWLLEHHPTRSGTVFDAGCGTGLFSIGMAAQGFDVTGVDIAPRMAAAATDAASRAGVSANTRFISGDIESVTDTFDAVVCLDVLVHYPRASFAGLLAHLAERSRGPLVITYAPYNRLLAGLHWLGGHFPQGQRRQEIQMIPDRLVAETLATAGMRVQRTVNISHGFYHVRLIEAGR